jgi:hypothetical protein
VAVQQSSTGSLEEHCGHALKVPGIFLALPPQMS